MESLVDPSLFESRIGFLVGVALLAVLFGAILVGFVAEELAGRKQRVEVRAAKAEGEKEQTRRAA